MELTNEFKFKKVINETPKAILVSYGIHRKRWFAKSEVKLIVETKTILLSDWLANKLVEEERQKERDKKKSVWKG